MSNSSKRDTTPADDDDSVVDGVRRKYKYRRLVMTQGVKIPARLAMKMVGPDCAYHLYSQHTPKTDAKPNSKTDS